MLTDDLTLDLFKAPEVIPFGQRPPRIMSPVEDCRPPKVSLEAREAKMRVPSKGPEGGVSLMDLKESHCRAVITASDASAARFCGASKHKGAYCRAHARIFYVPRSKRVSLSELLKNPLG